MIAARKIVQATLAVALLLIAPTARAQQPASPAMGPDLSTPALKYFGKGKHALASRSYLQRSAAQTRTYALTGIKPFQNVSTQLPTVTPYLSLDAVESNDGVPNYFTRVLPQLQQQQANQAQTAQLSRLQKQVRATNTPGNVATTRGGGVPTTGHGSQFLNHGSFFPAVQR